MKRIALCLLLLIFVLTAFSICPVTAVAEEDEYLLIANENVSLYADTRKAPALFTLPKTYYVKVLELNYDGTYHKVAYNGVEGLVKINEVSSKTVKGVQDPYYTAQTISAHISTHLYLQPSFAESADSGVGAYGKSLTFLGKISGEKGTYGTPTWFAVLYSGDVCYIHSAMTENLDLLESGIPAHPNSNVGSSTEEGKPNATSDKTKGSSDVDVVRILLILGMFVPIVIILVVLFRPRRKRARNRIDREEEDDDY